MEKDQDSIAASFKVSLVNKFRGATDLETEYVGTL